MDTNVSHDTEQRLRNVEAHLGIGSTDEETGEYTVKQYEETAEPTVARPGLDEGE
jgi:hypothetical protein